MSHETGQTASLSVVVPFWNEEAGAQRSLAALLDVMGEAVASGRVARGELIAVDDGSTDRTGSILRGLADRDDRVRVLTHRQNRGLGAAVRTGLAAASGTHVLYTDADLPSDPGEILRALDVMERYGADVVSAYRRDRAGEGLRRVVYSYGWNAAVRTLFRLSVRDVNFALKLIHRRVLETVPLSAAGSFIDAELLVGAHRAGYRIVQFGVDYHPRTRGVSTLSSLATISAMTKDALRYARRGPTTRGRERLLVVTGDDFGLTAGVSQAIAHAHDHGVVTSTSVLTVAPAFGESVPLLRTRPSLETGVHLAAVGEDPPLLPPGQLRSLVDRNGRLPPDWRAFLRAAATGRIDAAELRSEFSVQIQRALDAGLRPTHLNTHQHLHLWPTVGQVLCDLAVEYGIGVVRLPVAQRGWRSPLLFPLTADLRRRAGRAGLGHPTRSIGVDDAGHLDRGALLRVLRAQAGLQGSVELVCHPGPSDDPDLDRYRWGYDWANETVALCDPAVAEGVSEVGFRLGTMAELGVVGG